MSHAIELFCTPSDFALIVEDVGKRTPISFVVDGMSDTPDIRRLQGYSEVLAVALASTERINFLAVKGQDEIRVVERPQRLGRRRYAIDTLMNRRSILVCPGRLLDERTLLAGRVGTASNDPDSIGLFSLFRSAVRRRFVHIKCCWVGPESVRLLDSGGRLAFDLNAPPEFDLQR